MEPAALLPKERGAAAHRETLGGPSSRTIRHVLLAPRLPHPVLDPEFFEAGKVFGIGGDEHERVHLSDRCNLAIHVRRRSAERLKTRSLLAVPGCGNFVVWQDRKGFTHNVLEIGFERDPALALGQPTTAVREFVPHGSCNRAFRPVLLEPLENSGIRRLGDRSGHDARIQEIVECHSETLRPAVLSRVDVKSLLRPISSKEYFSRKLL